MIEISFDEAVRRQKLGELIFHEWVCPTCKKTLITSVGSLPIDGASFDLWCREIV